MGKKYLIDTNVLIEYVGQLLPDEIHKKIGAIIDKEFNISFINKIEVLGHHSSDQILEDFINIASIYNMDDDVIDQTIVLRKVHKIKIPDAVVAATAITYDLILLTRNVDDFKNIKKLKFENPWNWMK